MTDFFSELEGHLTDAARRRARRRLPALPSPRPALAVAAAVVAIVAVLVAISALGARDPEVAAPVPSPTPFATVDKPWPVTCGNEAIPSAIAQSFSVLRRPAEPADRMPERIAARVTGDLPGGRLPKVWTQDARRVSLQHGTYWVIPALIGRACTGPEGDPTGTREPGVCVVYEDGGSLLLPSCETLMQIRRGQLVTSGQTGDGRWFQAALVPDDIRAAVIVGGRREPGIVTQNIFEKAYTATAAEQEHATVVFETAAPDPGSSPCSAPSKVPTFTNEPPAPEVLATLSMFRSIPQSLSIAAGAWPMSLTGTIDAPLGVNLKYGRALGVHDGFSLDVVPVSHLIKRDDACAPVSTEIPAKPDPGLCLVHLAGDGAATETGSSCWTLAEVRDGKAIGFVTIDGGHVLTYAIVPDGTAKATLDGTDLKLEGNLGTAVTPTPGAGVRRLALEQVTGHNP